MIPLLFFIVWCCICSGTIAKSGKREVISPEIVRGGFAASSGPYGNEASATTLNYQAGNQGTYNNIDYSNGNGYGDYSGYNGQQQNIPVQEQPDTPTQNIRVPVWSPPTPSQNPYTAPPQPQANLFPQGELIQVPVQQALQAAYQADPQFQQQQAYIPQQGYEAQAPQQFTNVDGQGAPQSYQNNVPIFLGASSSVNDQSQYNAVPSYNHGVPSQANISPEISSPYNSGIPPQANLPPPGSSAANIAASYSGPLSTQQANLGSIPSSIASGIPSSLPPFHGRSLPSFVRGRSPSISSGTPSRLVGKSFARGASSIGSSLGGSLHSLDDVLSGGISDFNANSFGSSFGNGFGFGGFDLTGFGSNYFGGVGGFGNSFGGFGKIPFSGGISYGGTKGGLGTNLGGVNSAKFANLANTIPLDNKFPSAASSPSLQIPQNLPQSGPSNAVPSSNVPIGPQNLPSDQHAINQPVQAQPAKN